jgi:heme-degrading monooxygenase HmoA
MMIRIVKMRFKAEEVEAFKAFFMTAKSRIRNFEGCQHLELWQEMNDEQTFFTYSHWDNESCLENYRQSDVFKEFWKVAKSKFSDKPEAWSHKQITQV